MLCVVWTSTRLPASTRRRLAPSTSSGWRTMPLEFPFATSRSGGVVERSRRGRRRTLGAGERNASVVLMGAAWPRRSCTGMEPSLLLWCGFPHPSSGRSRHGAAVFVEVARERVAHRRAGSMQEHPLVSRADLQVLADLLRAQPLDVAEDDDVPLRGREQVECRADAREQLLPHDLLVRRGRLRRLLDHRQRDDPPLALHLRVGRVDEDPEDPGLQARAALEALDAARDGRPGVLDDLLRHRAAAAVRHRERDQAPVIPCIQLRVGARVARAQGRDEAALAEIDDVHSGSACSSESRTTSAPASASSARLKWPLATATAIAPAPWAACTSSGVSPTTRQRAGVTEPPSSAAARAIARLVSSVRSVESEP